MPPDWFYPLLFGSIAAFLASVFAGVGVAIGYFIWG